jgi:ABC-type multidrug transport system fused ATPase/permease subunit
LGLSILNATRDLAVALVDVTQHVARLTEAIATLLLPHELQDHPKAEPLIKAGAAITFNSVSFRYPGGLKVFDRFSLRLQPGQRVGLVGQSGGGKSSLFVLLQRFYDAQHGGITIDGQNISRVTQQSLREAISVVPQDISLFHRSIMENVRYGRPTATDNEVLRAAIAARCDFVETLPEGLATMVGDRGVKLSGGQRQRIAIARAFLKDAPILLLDEATAALDSESEEAIREALGRLMRGRTVIAIAHRLATLRDAESGQDHRRRFAGSPDAGPGPIPRVGDAGNETPCNTRGLNYRLSLRRAWELSGSLCRRPNSRLDCADALKLGLHRIRVGHLCGGGFVEKADLPEQNSITFDRRQLPLIT